KDVLAPIGDAREGNGEISQQLGVGRSEVSSTLVPIVEMCELHAKDRRWELVQPAVTGGGFVNVIVGQTVIAERSHALGQPLVVRDNGAPIPVGAQVLRG